MKITQNKHDGSGLIIFTHEEIEILNDKGCFEIPAATLKQISNHLVKLAAEVHDYFPEEVLSITSSEDDHIQLEKKEVKKLEK